MLHQTLFLVKMMSWSRVAQWKRAGPITQRSVDRNYALLKHFRELFSSFSKSVSRRVFQQLPEPGIEPGTFRSSV